MAKPTTVDYKDFTLIEDPDNLGQPKPVATKPGGDLLQKGLWRSADRLREFDRQHLPSPPPVAIVASMQDNETWESTTGDIVVTNDETAANVKIGHQSKKLACAANASGLVHCMTSGLTPTVEIRGNVGIWIKCDDVSEIKNFDVRFHEDKGDTTKHHYFRVIYNSDNDYYNLQDDEWKLCWATRKGFGIGGTPATWDKDSPLKKVEGIRCSVVVDTVGCNIWIGGIVTQTWPKAYFVLTLDDGYVSHYNTVWPAFAARGWKFTPFICAANVGLAGYCTAAQITEMYNDGMDAGNHRYTHGQWDAATAVATVHSECASARTYHANNGWERGADIIAWPGNAGRCVGDITADIARLYFRAARHNTAWDGVYSLDSGGPPYDMVNYGGTVIPWHLFNVPAKGIGDEPVPWATLQGYLEECQADRGLYVATSHDIKVAPTSTNMSPGYFNSLMAWLDARVAEGTWEVLSLSQLLDMVYGNPNWDNSGDGYGALSQVW